MSKEALAMLSRRCLPMLFGLVLVSSCAVMKHEETYHGQRIIVTTLKHSEGYWTSQAEVFDSEQKNPVPMVSDQRFQSEEEARQSALSAAAGAIDGTRIFKGKP